MRVVYACQIGISEVAGEVAVAQSAYHNQLQQTHSQQFRERVVTRHFEAQQKAPDALEGLDHVGLNKPLSRFL